MKEDHFERKKPETLTETEKDHIRKVIFQSLSAEFAQPLNLIAMNREYLSMYLEKQGSSFCGEKVRESLGSIEYATAQLDRLMNNCLDLMACLQERTRPQLMAVDLWAVAKDIYADRDEIRRLMDISIQMEEPEQEIWVNTDRFMAERVLLNLLSNALKASTPGSRILLSFKKKEDACIFSIADEGCGVSAAFAAQAFSPMRTEKGCAGGTGLGLYLCGEFCRMLGWTPEMRPARKGTIVDVRIPAEQLVTGRKLVFHSFLGEESMGREAERRAVLQELRTVPGLEKLKGTRE